MTEPLTKSSTSVPLVGDIGLARQALSSAPKQTATCQTQGPQASTSSSQPVAPVPRSARGSPPVPVTGKRDHSAIEQGSDVLEVSLMFFGSFVPAF